MTPRQVYVVVGVKGFQAFSTRVVANGLIGELRELGWHVTEVGLSPNRSEGRLRFFKEAMFRYLILPYYCRKSIPKDSLVYIVDHADSTVVRWLKKATSVIHVHDLTSLRPPWDYPFTVTAKALVIFILSAIFKRPGIKHAHKLVSISHFTADEIEKYLGISRNRIEVVYNGVEKPNVSSSQTPLKLKLGIASDAQVMISVGPASLRKNYMTIANAFIELDSNWIWLHIGAIDKATQEYLTKSGKIDRVIVVKFIDEIGEAYTIGDVLVHASHYEGFGLPVLEAMLVGLPTVSIDKPVSREIYGIYTSYFSTPNELANTLNKQTYKSIDTAAAADHASQYSWHRAGQKIHGILTEIYQ